MRKLSVLFGTIMIVGMFVLTGCGTENVSVENEVEEASVDVEDTNVEEDNVDVEQKVSGKPTEDRSGNPVSIPENIQRIISVAPSITQVIDDIGYKGDLVAVDSQSPKHVEGLEELPQFNMMQPDIEALAALNPDIVFVSGMSAASGTNPFAALADLGICVVVIPSSTSIEGIKEDIQFIADVLGASEKGEELNQEMEKRIARVEAIGKNIEEPKTVMFEIATLPNIYSFGKNTFLHEMLEIIGAKNVFEDQESWIPVSEEAALVANPDVILTNVSYVEEPVADIMGREGWENMQAIQAGSVYAVDNETSSLSNHNIVEALEYMAYIIYPEEYAEFGVE